MGNQKIVTEVVLNYRDFLLASWCYYEKADDKVDWHENPFFLEKWMQVTWEMLVEQPLLDFDSGQRMLPFSDGETMIFDYKQLKPTHGIFVCKKKGARFFKDARGIKIPEDKLFVPSYLMSVVEKDGGPENGPVYAYGPPFDFITIKEHGLKNFYRVKVVDVDFFLKSL